ncbi:hypothetical protein F0Q45_19490 [Mycobacterium simiae]|uniref:Uncharacterized protein n=1 Tax=Mycobacterium simiae TaxID=1784 RepID=A0A5B1BIZ7_MYCSI|nr:Rv1535 family protein [Mycobacterium simiae]KAA1248637.1 hypothetical protein F0Q45_19490 [Mycobacterium simiae]
MTAVLYESDSSALTAPCKRRISNPDHLPAFPAPSDPIVDTTARLLSIPLRHVYALLWRVGVIEVTA